MGLSYDGLEATAQSASDDYFTYPTILDTMVSQGVISCRAYSLYLDDLSASTGGLIFGGYDTEKYTGSLVTLPNVLSDPVLSVPLSSITFTDPAGSTTTLATGSVGVILDSGTPISRLPSDVFDDLVAAVEGLNYQVESSDDYGYVVDCALGQASGYLNLGFEDPDTGNSVVISVPFSELAVPESDICVFGATPQDYQDLVFGDTFMRSMYIVYDLDSYQISLAQSNFNSASSNVVPF